MESAVFLLVQSFTIAFLAFLLLLALFEPGLRYKVGRSPSVPLESEDFLRVLSALAGGQAHPGGRVEVLTNGEAFYAAELEAIRAARHSVNLEAYIFRPGEVARRFIAALAERAEAGVAVHLVLDAVGCFRTSRRYLADLIEAGGFVEFYHPIRWHTLPRINNRTHRELIVIDGRVGFLGGAGFADHWLYPPRRRRAKNRWRDTMVRIEGEVVRDLQATFAENWLEASGRLLADPAYYPRWESRGPTVGMIVRSSPTVGRSARNRMLFQMLLASARKSIHITTPYFLPDRSARAELVRAVQERGAEVKIIVPGKRIDHQITRWSSRRLFGELLRAGVKIYEYQPSMIHAKCLVIDGVWSVVGSTNFDNRSFGLNKEVNLAAYDPELAARLDHDFAADLAMSQAVTYRRWRQRPFFEKANALLGRLLERQQ